MDGNASFGLWLRRRRKVLDLTQADLARRVGCAEVTIRKIEADERRPSQQIARRLADCLALSAADHAAFLKAAHGELGADRLAPPEQTRTELPTGTVTFLFTDIVGSTQLWEQHPDAMHQALARHDAILRTAIEARGGVVVKSTGDGVLAAFTLATDALAMALDLQRALRAEPWGVTGPLAVRVALHVGSAQARAGDYFGAPLNRCARMLAAGYGGQILLSRAAQELVCDQLPADVELRDLGSHRLKDLTRPEHIFQVAAPDLPADFPPLRTPDAHRHNLPRQLAQHIFISYKRDTADDEPLTLRLHDAFEQAGHNVFIDQRIKVGVEWAREIQRQIEASDFLIVLLSEVSTQSEMVAKEIEYADQLRQQTGRPQILPVRVNYPGLLPYQLSYYLDKLQQAKWQGDDDTERLIDQLLDAIGELAPLPMPDPQPPPTSQADTHPAPPNPVADLRFIETLQDPFGTVRLRSEFYIERDGDERFYRELRKPYGTTTTIRAPRQSGKSSLLIRGLAQAQARDSKIISIDLQPIEKSYLQSLDVFLQNFAMVIAAQLRLDPAKVERAWRSPLGAPDKATHLMEDYILPQAGANIVLAIDEADRLLGAAFQDSFFGLLRFWNNNRAKNDLWDRLSLVLVISTEPHLLIEDVAQSPFNVGVRIQLEDFDQAQVEELNRRYRSPLAEQELLTLAGFLGGHPYLTRKALYTLVTDTLTWEQLRQIAVGAKSPFGDHLRHFLWILRDQPELRAALKQIIVHGQCSDEVAFYRLEQAGLAKGADSKTCRCRCQLYEHYFKDML
jgi:class 3 adenylate cyclase